jgi:hypothetical protein
LNLLSFGVSKIEPKSDRKINQTWDSLFVGIETNITKRVYLFSIEVTNKEARKTNVFEDFKPGGVNYYNSQPNGDHSKHEFLN